MKKTSLWACLLMFVYAAPAIGAPRSVAVMNFTNHGGPGIQYLAKSIPESLSAALSVSKDLRVVEREQLGKLLNEIALEQTGIFSEAGVSRAGRLARADVLILGSYSGTPDRLVLTLKAVEVVSGKVMDGRVVKAPLSDIFDRAGEAVLSMAAVITGKDLGYLSVSTTPGRADIYIDGNLAGKSPLVDYRLPAGRHRLKAVKSGYMEADTTVTILKDKYVSWSPFMAEDKVKDRTSIGAGVYYLRPLKDEISGGPFFTIFLNHNFQQVMLSAEAGYSRINHDQDIDSPFGGTITQERWYNMYTLQGHLAVMPFPGWDIFQPYFGGFVGWLNLQDFRKNSQAEDDQEKLLVQNRLTLGARIGANVVPFARVSLFVEGRFYYTPAKITRYYYESQLLGDLIKKEEKYHFNAVTIGGGVKLYFN